MFKKGIFIVLRVLLGILIIPFFAVGALCFMFASALAWILNYFEEY